MRIDEMCDYARDLVEALQIVDSQDGKITQRTINEIFSDWRKHDELWKGVSDAERRDIVNLAAFVAEMQWSAVRLLTSAYERQRERIGTTLRRHSKAEKSGRVAVINKHPRPALRATGKQRSH